MEEKRLEENRHLREQLDKLLREARRNEQTQTSFDDFSLSVVAAQGPKELFDLILHDQKKFRIDEIRLCLIDRYHEVERLLTESYQHSYPGLSFIDTDTRDMLISDVPDLPVLGSVGMVWTNEQVKIRKRRHYAFVLTLFLLLSVYGVVSTVFVLDVDLVDYFSEIYVNKKADPKQMLFGIRIFKHFIVNENKHVRVLFFRMLKETWKINPKLVRRFFTVITQYSHFYSFVNKDQNQQWVTATVENNKTPLNNKSLKKGHNK